MLALLPGVNFILDGVLKRDEAFPFHCFFPLSQPINTINTVLTFRVLQSTRLFCSSLISMCSTALCHLLLLIPATAPKRGSTRNYGTERNTSCLSSSVMHFPEPCFQTPHLLEEVSNCSDDCTLSRKEQVFTCNNHCMCNSPSELYPSL